MTSVQRAGRGVAAVNATLALGLVVALAAFALVVNPPAPPGIQEFAPQATKPITKAPPALRSAHGTGPGGACLSGTGCGPSPTPSAVGAPVPVPRRSGGVSSTKQCYEWADGSVTQTWDPQSPPCIADWPEHAQGNGGATSRGVTATTIRVAIPWSYRDYNGQALVDFFNTHFELYDRRLVGVRFTAQAGDPTTGLRSPSAQRADAQTAESLNPFASFSYIQDGGQASTQTFTQGLTSARIVSVGAATQVSIGSEGQLRAAAPYAWNYHPTSADLLDATATMVCRQLVGRPATHSLDYATTKRSFAIVIPDQDYLHTPLDGVEQLRDALAGCGAPRPRVVEFRNPQGGADPSPNVTAMVQLKRDGITSLIFWPTSAGTASAGAPQKAASSVAYHPEWIVPGYSADTVYALGVGAPDELRSTFGLAGWNPLRPEPQRPWYRAYADSAGHTPPDTASSSDGDALYRSLLLLASGIQMAGPRLTATGFSQALGSTEFPNPGAGSRPDYQAHVGFSGDHVMVDDFAAFWFDPGQSPDPTGDPATDPFCYVASGRRWTARSWPTGPDLFHPGSGC